MNRSIALVRKDTESPQLSLFGAGHTPHLTLVKKSSEVNELIGLGQTLRKPAESLRQKIQTNTAHNNKKISPLDKRVMALFDEMKNGITREGLENILDGFLKLTSEDPKIGASHETWRILYHCLKATDNEKYNKIKQDIANELDVQLFSNITANDVAFFGQAFANVVYKI